MVFFNLQKSAVCIIQPRGVFLGWKLLPHAIHASRTATWKELGGITAQAVLSDLRWRSQILWDMDAKYVFWCTYGHLFVGLLGKGHSGHSGHRHEGDVAQALGIGTSWSIWHRAPDPGVTGTRVRAHGSLCTCFGHPLSRISEDARELNSSGLPDVLWLSFKPWIVNLG